MKIGLILPTYNVEKTLAQALEEVARLLHKGAAELLVIDNASTDLSRPILKDFFTNNAVPSKSCTIRFNESNRGYGASIKAGFRFFLTRDVTHVLVLHSDAQTDNYLLANELVRVGAEFESDVILGTRFAAGSDISAYSALRKYGNYFFNWLTKLTTGLTVSDAGAAMVLIPITALNRVEYWKLPEDWKFHPQLNIDLGRMNGLKIREVPIRWADSDADSSVPLLSYGFSLLWMLLGAWTQGKTQRTLESPLRLDENSGPDIPCSIWSVEDFINEK
jgi:glycosyltransferase involved in cell wall biosynthesis